MKRGLSRIFSNPGPVVGSIYFQQRPSYRVLSLGGANVLGAPLARVFGAVSSIGPGTASFGFNEGGVSASSGFGGGANFGVWLLPVVVDGVVIGLDVTVLEVLGVTVAIGALLIGTVDIGIVETDTRSLPQASSGIRLTIVRGTRYV